jgi:hypothetical protein
MSKIPTCKQCDWPLIAMASEDGIESTLVGTEIGLCGARHDDNCLNRAAWCKFGHQTAISIRRTCTACDWKGRQRCDSCGLGIDKLDAWPDLPIGRPPPSLIVHPDDASLVDVSVRK